MITLNELKALIQVEKRIRPGNDHDTHLRFKFHEPSREIEKQIQEEFGINYATKFMLESYCWRTFEYVNDHLRETCGIPNDEFVIEYQKTFNKLLDGINSCNENTIWRWVNCFEGFEFLKTMKGKVIQIPEFKSTSLRKLPKRTYWSVKTKNQSNGKMIYKHINKEKGNAEQEILFKSGSTFEILNSDENCIYLQEVNGETIDLVLCENYWRV